MVIGRFKLAFVFSLLGFALIGCVENERFRLHSDFERQTTRERCFDCDSTQLIAGSPIEAVTEEIRGLDQSCQVAEDCILVSLDIVCDKSFLSIANEQVENYTDIVDQYFEQNSEPHYCSDEWSPRFDINNYESQCVQNQCRAVYLGSSGS